MSVVVLQSRDEIEASQRRLAMRGLTGEPLLSRLRYLIRAGHRRPVPDPRKSWDLERAIATIEATTDKASPIVDLGAYNSAILPALHQLGYRRLIGIDLDPRIRLGPFARSIDYRVRDFHETGLQDSSCQAVTAISTIEHGWRGPELLREVARILRPGGVFVASTDYWPTKIDTTGLMPFGMSWTVFSAEEIDALFSAARNVGLEPTGPLQLDANEAPIEWNDRAYTFALLTLTKRART